jgi:hypothetical protein
MLRIFYVYLYHRTVTVLPIRNVFARIQIIKSIFINFGSGYDSGLAPNQTLSKMKKQIKFFQICGLVRIRIQMTKMAHKNRKKLRNFMF